MLVYEELLCDKGIVYPQAPLSAEESTDSSTGTTTSSTTDSTTCSCECDGCQSGGEEEEEKALSILQLWYKIDKHGIVPRTVEQAVYSTDGVKLSATLETIRQRIAALEQDKAPELKIVDNLMTASAYRALSANQGVVLKGLIDAMDTAYKEADTALDTAYKEADTQIRADYAIADSELQESYENADTQIRTDFAEADEQLQTQIDTKLTYKLCTYAEYAQWLSEGSIDNNTLYCCKKGSRVKTMYFGKLIYNPEDDAVVRITSNYDEAILNAETMKVPTASLTIVGNTGVITASGDEGVTVTYDYATDPTTLKIRLDSINETDTDKEYHAYAVGVNGGMCTITIIQKAKQPDDEEG